MGKKNVLLQANHGPIVAAVDVATAWWYLYYLERAAKLTLAAMSTGRPLRTISDKVGGLLYESFEICCISEYARGGGGFPLGSRSQSLWLLRA